jgi:hypothetical protein
LWWGSDGKPGYFERMQKSLRSAALACLDAFAAEKYPHNTQLKKSILLYIFSVFRYVRSVTEEEVVNGIFEVPNAEQRSIFFQRDYTNINLGDNDAWKFVDMIGYKQKKKEKKNLIYLQVKLKIQMQQDF